MTTQTQAYDLDAIASAVGIKPERTRLIISELVEKFRFNAETVPQNSLVGIIGSIVALQQTHNLSPQSAVAKYVETLQQQQKKSGGKTEFVAETMAEEIKGMASAISQKVTPQIVKAAKQQIKSDVMEALIKEFQLGDIEDCFDQTALILECQFQEVEKSERFLSGQENVLHYFPALPQAK